MADGSVSAGVASGNVMAASAASRGASASVPARTVAAGVGAGRSATSSTGGAAEPAGRRWRSGSVGPPRMVPTGVHDPDRRHDRVSGGSHRHGHAFAVLGDDRLELEVVLEPF